MRALVPRGRKTFTKPFSEKKKKRIVRDYEEPSSVNLCVDPYSKSLSRNDFASLRRTNVEHGLSNIVSALR